MAFASELRNSLQHRTTSVPVELAEGRTLAEVLNRHLLTVESLADSVMLTSILLLDSEGRRLRHAAAPSLPKTYCDAIDGSEIGPAAGSCGTAAFLGHAIYVEDIATDPLWADYHQLALPHGLRACWSTPIRDHRGLLVGTFAVYHPTPRLPTEEEVAAIDMIAGHVAPAIEWFRSPEDLGESGRLSTGTGDMSLIAADFEKIVHAIERAIRLFPQADLDALNRARRAAERGARIARNNVESD